MDMEEIMIKHFKPLKSVFYRMLLSYNVLVLITAITAGVVFNHYSFKEFYNEAIHSNNEILYYLNRFADASVFRYVEDLYVKISMENSQYESLFSSRTNINDAVVVNSIYRTLNDIKSANIDVIDDIHLYYIKDNTAISTKYGVKYLGDPNSARFINTDWIEAARNLNSASGWIGRDVRSGNAVDTYFTLVKIYPYGATASQRRMYVAFDVNAAVLSNLISQTQQTKLTSTLITDQNNHIIAYNLDKNEFNNIDAFTELLENVNFSDTSGNFRYTIANHDSVVSYETMNRSKWHIITVNSMAHLSESFSNVQIALFIICMGIILIGIILSVFFSRNLYSPIRSVVSVIRGAIGENIGSIENEYQFINRSIDKLKDKADKLEYLSSKNEPFLKHNLVTGALNNSTGTNYDFMEYSNLLGIDFAFPGYYAAILRFDETIYDNLNIENKELVRFDAISFIEKFSNGDMVWLAAYMTYSSIGILINAEFYQTDKIVSCLEILVHYLNSNYHLSCAAALGTAAHSPALHPSYKNALTAAKYQYFLPQCSVITYEMIELRDLSNKHLPEAYLKDFSQALASGREDILEKLLDNLIEEITKGNYNHEYCNEFLMKLVSTFSNYIKEFNVETKVLISKDIYQQFLQIKNINELKTWLLSGTEQVFHVVNNEVKNVNHRMVLTIKDYCEQNLAGDLSLTAISDLVNVSSRHVNKIFKDETGTTISDYVFEKRLSRAKVLLVESNSKIEDIALKVGFNTTHYFIKKFKEKYGMTPRQYRQYMQN